LKSLSKHASDSEAKNTSVTAVAAIPVGIRQSVYVLHPPLTWVVVGRLCVGFTLNAKKAKLGGNMKLDSEALAARGTGSSGSSFISLCHT
jgi:hypothetical protein